MKGTPEMVSAAEAATIARIGLVLAIIGQNLRDALISL
jgi:hypothetical protein